eukprot:1159478-Pelagomonas_calceolata.AAC.17
MAPVGPKLLTAHQPAHHQQRTCWTRSRLCQPVPTTSSAPSAIRPGSKRGAKLCLGAGAAELGNAATSVCHGGNMNGNGEC